MSIKVLQSAKGCAKIAAHKDQQSLPLLVLAADHN